MLQIRPLRSDRDYRAALAAIDRLWGAKAGSPEGDRLEVLALLVERYERERWPVGAVDPIDVIEFFMDQNGYGPSDLARVLGSAPRVSEVLGRRRALTLGMIRKLAAGWRIPVELLVQPYQLRRRAA
jgi:antitoxin component HigA of HigAB toxin-antitoxin module